MPERRTLVVGATSDYIETIHRRFPGRALFITDPAERARAHEPRPEPRAEVLCALTRPDEALSALRRRLARWRIDLSGVTCFDCESLDLAARLASALSHSFPSTEAVAACRSKFECKRLWQAAGLPCPRSELVSELDEAFRFMARVRRPIVIKPLTGSGSELTFLCEGEASCREAFAVLSSRLPFHGDTRMYAAFPGEQDGRPPDPHRTFIAEEFIDGEEYSCDFALDDGRVTVIRIARKAPARDHSFGTTRAYLVPAKLPEPVNSGFERQLLEASQAVGLVRCLCMLDFVVRDGRAFMLEVAPRPGGDCLPPLILRSSGLDILGLALDFAEMKELDLPDPSRWRPLVGARLLADRAGLLRRVDDSALRRDTRVIESYVKVGPDHRVLLPPEDYDSRVLGHVLFAPLHLADFEAECRELLRGLQLVWEDAPCATTAS